jgi:transposase InsO family protein
LPSELQHEVEAVVEQTKERSGWPAQRTLQALGVAPSSYYRWRRVAASLRAVTGLSGSPPRCVTLYEALPEERAAVRAYALAHPEVRHRELAWRMVDENVVCLSPSTVYRILREERLVCPWRRRTKRQREQAEKASRPNERWASDLMHLRIGARWYYLVSFLDEYSRCIVHHELLTTMDGNSVSLAAQAAVETLPRDAWGQPIVRPEIRTDNGSGYVSREFREVLSEHELAHQRIKPHCPEENGVMERAYRTLREALDGHEMKDFQQAERVLNRVVSWYNNERLHRALGYLRPVDYYAGNPQAMHEARRRKLAMARHQRRETNLRLRQRTLPLGA